MYIRKKDLVGLLHGVFNLTIHESVCHGCGRWSVCELNDIEKSITDFVINQYKKEQEQKHEKNHDIRRI